jgi:hypothetical protein
MKKILATLLFSSIGLASVQNAHAEFQTSSRPIYTSKNGLSFNVQSTTHVSGGSAYDGSQTVLVPSTAAGSTASSSYGIGITIPLK